MTELLKLNKISLMLGLIFLVLAYIGLEIYFFFNIPPIILKRLDSYASNIEEVSLPPESIKLGKIYKEFGLMGNGNHCDYGVSFLLQSNLSEAQLKEFYDSKFLPAVDPEGWIENKKRGSSPNRIVVIPYKDKKMSESMAQNYEINSAQNLDKVYLISSVDFGYSADYMVCN